MATLERIEPIEKAFARLRESTLEEAGNEDIFIYRHASMRIADFLPDELNLTSLYVLNDHIESLRALRAEFIDRYGIDILQMLYILHIRTEDGRLVSMAPPFVEIYKETVRVIPRNGDRLPETLSLQVPILKDGIHRAWIAREEGIPIKCIVIRGALEDYPPYAYPNAWDQVQLYDTKPPAIKKFYRRQTQHSYMRPLRALRQIGDTPPPREYGR